MLIPLVYTYMCVCVYDRNSPTINYIPKEHSCLNTAAPGHVRYVIATTSVINSIVIYKHADVLEYKNKYNNKETNK